MTRTIKVVSAEDMLTQQFRMHIRSRHPRVRFMQRQLHDTDHLVYGDRLDHTHAPQAEQDTPDEQQSPPPRPQDPQVHREERPAVTTTRRPLTATRGWTEFRLPGSR